MKRLICLLLALFLPLTASAETLKTTLGVPDHVNLSFTTNTGVTTINVNADVVMPDVESVSVYDYVPTRVPEEQALTMARALGLEEIRDVRYEWLDDKNLYSVYTDYTGEFFRYNADLNKWAFRAMSKVWHGKPYGGEIYYRLNGAEIEYSTYYDLHPYGTLPENGRYSREEARQMALDLAAQVAPDYVLAQEGVISGLQYSLDDTDEAMVADLFIPTGYKFVFNRVIDGIPITIASPIDNPLVKNVDADFINGEYMPRLSDEKLTMAISDEGFQEVVLTNPFAVGEPIEESPDLLPFESILDIAQSILPVKMLLFEGSEYQEEYRVEIDRIVFGYMMVLKPNAPREYMLVPVWDLFGNQLMGDAVSGSYDERTRTWQYEYETSMTDDFDTSFLTIDARTGLVIDREYGY